MNKIAIITGGNRGIGRAISLELAKKGYDIWIVYKSNQKTAEETKKMIEYIGKNCTTLQIDVSSKEMVKEKLGKKVSDIDENSQISILVNNAGIVKDSLFFWMKDEDWENVINVTLNGFFYVTKTVIEHMINKGNGNIINVSSLASFSENIGQINYSSAKSALNTATKILAKELGRNGIRVNAVAPGVIETDMTDNLKQNKKLLKEIPLKRFGKPEEVAKVVGFLCSEDASYINGAIIPVSGGLS